MKEYLASSTLMKPIHLCPPHSHYAFRGAQIRANTLSDAPILEQLEEEVWSAVLRNVGTNICFRLGAADAKVMEQEFYPVFSQEDFVNLPKYHIYVKLLIDGSAEKGFSAITTT